MEYEIIISGESVLYVNFIDGKKITSKKINQIEDKELIQKIKNVESWLKIHPIGNYYMDENEYQDYKKFMEEKRYFKNKI